MADTDRDINVRVRAVDEASSVFKNVAHSAKKELGTIGTLKESFGKESTLKETLEIFRGAGAVAGLTLGGIALKEAAESAARLKEELHSSAMSGGEVTDRIVSLVPIVGQFWQAGRAIHELMTGEEAAAKATREEAQQGIEFMQTRLELQKQAIKQTEAWRDRMRELHNEDRLVGLKNGALTQEQDRQDRDKVGVNARKSAKNDIDALNEAATAKVKEINAKISKIQENGKGGQLPTEEFNKLQRLRAEKEQIGKDFDEAVKKRQGQAATEEQQGGFTLQRKQQQRDLDAIIAHGKEVVQAEEEVARRRAAARRDGLRLVGKDLEADLDKIDEDRRKKMNDLGRRTADEFLKHPFDLGLPGRAMNEGKAIQDEADADAAKARAADRERQVGLEQQRVAAERAVRDAGEDAQKRELESMGKAGEMRLRELETTRQIRAEREKIEDMLREEEELDRQGKGRMSASAENAARARVLQLLGQEKDAKRLSFRPLSGSAAANLAPSENTPFEQGIASRFRFQMEAQAGPDSALEEAKNQSKFLQELLQVLGQFKDPFVKIAPDLGKFLLAQLLPGAAPLIFNGGVPGPSGN